MFENGVFDALCFLGQGQDNGLLHERLVKKHYIFVTNVICNKTVIFV
jgi:hypothetical protein